MVFAAWIIGCSLYSSPANPVFADFFMVQKPEKCIPIPHRNRCKRNCTFQPIQYYRLDERFQYIRKQKNAFHNRFDTVYLMVHRYFYHDIVNYKINAPFSQYEKLCAAIAESGCTHTVLWMFRWNAYKKAYSYLQYGIFEIAYHYRIIETVYLYANPSDFRL